MQWMCKGRDCKKAILPAAIADKMYHILTLLADWNIIDILFAETVQRLKTYFYPWLFEIVGSYEFSTCNLKKSWALLSRIKENCNRIVILFRDWLIFSPKDETDKAVWHQINPIRFDFRQIVTTMKMAAKSAWKFQCSIAYNQRTTSKALIQKNKMYQQSMLSTTQSCRNMLEEVSLHWFTVHIIWKATDRDEWSNAAPLQTGVSYQKSFTGDFNTVTTTVDDIECIFVLYPRDRDLNVPTNH